MLDHDLQPGDESPRISDRQLRSYCKAALAIEPNATPEGIAAFAANRARIDQHNKRVTALVDRAREADYWARFDEIFVRLVSNVDDPREVTDAYIDRCLIAAGTAAAALSRIPSRGS